MVCLTTNIMKLMNRALILPAVIISLLLCNSCGLLEEDKQLESRVLHDEIWFKQANMSLGARIQMFSDNSGVAISRGKGNDEKGELLLFDEGRWKSVYNFNYSDYPLTAMYNEDEIWFVIHETHFGYYKPRHYSYSISRNAVSEIELPLIKWDETDYAMWKDISVLNNGTAWMVGQQGNILYFDGVKWNVVESPAKAGERENLLSGDLNSVFMLNGNIGWAAGRSGIILKMKNGIWVREKSPVNTELFSICMLDENNGWITGSNGTILKYQSGRWEKYESGSRANLYSIKCLNKNEIYIAGSQSTLLKFSGNKWQHNENIKLFEESFTDLGIVLNSKGEEKIWLVGEYGIYTTNQNLGFSFSDVTLISSLSRDGLGGIFFDENNNIYPDLFLMTEKGSNKFYRNEEGGSFREIAFNLEHERKLDNSKNVLVADLNNDGYHDIFELFDDINFKVSFGNVSGGFTDKTEFTQLKLDFIPSLSAINSIKTADFDNDGYLDIYISNYSENDMLFKNDGAGRFENIYESSGINKLLGHQAHGIVTGDFNDDGLIDIVIVYRLTFENKHAELFLNKGNFIFEKHETNFSSSQNPQTYSAAADDFNADGFLDLLFLVNLGGIKLFLNDGSANFTDASQQYGFDEEILLPDPTNGLMNAADINNDGYVDFFAGSALYLNHKGKSFDEIQDQVGLQFNGNPAFVDYDNDGDMDIFLGSSRTALGAGDRAALFRNNLAERNFLKVKLECDLSNRFGIATKLTLEGFDSQDNIVYKYSKQTGVGGSPMIQQDHTIIHFGLDPSLKYRLIVKFPSGIVKEITPINNGSLISVVESNILTHHFILFKMSLYRIFLISDPGLEIMKLFLLAVIIMLSILLAKKLKAKSLMKKWHYPAGVIILYLITFYLTAESGSLYSTFARFSLSVIYMMFFITVSNYYIEKKESRYISRYKLIDILGVGGMGKVFKAVDTKTKQQVALKVINPSVLKDAENKKRLISEGEILSSFDHPNIVKVYEIGSDRGHSFIAMEYLSGGTLEEYLEKNPKIETSEALKIILQICDGVEVIHEKKVLHRDLKTANIMFDKDGNLKIMDFGLSKSPLVSTMTSLGTAVGTLGYVAPEQVTNIQVDQRTDIFSLGVIMYQIFAKELPFKGENEIALIHSIFNVNPIPPSLKNSLATKAIDSVVMHALEKNPENRYNSIAELKLEIKKLIP